MLSTDPDTGSMDDMATGVQQRAVRLEAATIGWDVIEAVVALAGGIAASSVALVGFGLDSLIEVATAGVVVWQLVGMAGARERLALRAIAVGFYVLAAYIALASARDLLGHHRPDASAVGIVLTVGSLVVMPTLAWAKHRAGHQLDSRTLIADAAQSRLCAYLAAATLAGLVANAWLGWWWADPAAALVIAGLAVNEGRQAWRGELCC